MLRRYEAVEVREPMESLLYMKSWRIVRIGRENQIPGTCLEQGRQIVALSVTVHICLSESEVAHHAEAYPKRGIEDPELGCQSRNRVSFICRGPRRRENVNVRVRHNPQSTLCYPGHHATTSGLEREQSAFRELW
jgi:hypothetical protein